MGPDILQHSFAQLSVAVGMNRRIYVQALNVFRTAVGLPAYPEYLSAITELVAAWPRVLFSATTVRFINISNFDLRH